MTEWKPKYKIGERVIVTTCSGEYEGKVREYCLFSFGPEMAYKITGPKIQSTAKEEGVKPWEDRKLFQGSTCSTCLNSSDCCFKDNKMKTYKAIFTGRTNGAIGIVYEITDTVKGENKEKAHLNLYEKYEHISCLRLTEIN